MCVKHFIKTLHFYCRHKAISILASALTRSVKTGICPTQWLDLVGISLCAKDYQSIPKVSRVMGIFANCHILASALPRSGKSGICNSFGWIMSILIRIQNFIKISHMVEDLR